MKIVIKLFDAILGIIIDSGKETVTNIVETYRNTPGRPESEIQRRMKTASDAKLASVLENCECEHCVR